MSGQHREPAEPRIGLLLAFSLAALAFILVAMLAACGAPVPHRAPRGASSRSPAAPAVIRLTRPQMRQECAALDMVRLGYDTYASQIATVAGQYVVDRHEAAALIRQAVTRYCPAEVQVLP